MPLAWQRQVSTLISRLFACRSILTVKPVAVLLYPFNSVLALRHPKYCFLSRCLRLSLSGKLQSQALLAL